MEVIFVASPPPCNKKSIQLTRRINPNVINVKQQKIFKEVISNKYVDSIYRAHIYSLAHDCSNSNALAILREAIDMISVPIAPAESSNKEFALASVFVGTRPIFKRPILVLYHIFAGNAGFMA